MQPAGPLVYLESSAREAAIQDTEDRLTIRPIRRCIQNEWYKERFTLLIADSR
jgi:hypothetical protein